MNEDEIKMLKPGTDVTEVVKSAQEFCEKLRVQAMETLQKMAEALTKGAENNYNNESKTEIGVRCGQLISLSQGCVKDFELLHQLWTAISLQGLIDDSTDGGKELDACAEILKCISKHTEIYKSMVDTVARVEIFVRGKIQEQRATA